MNHETDNFLAEVMGEGAPADFREAMLDGALREARRRRQRRHALRAMPVIIALALIAVFAHRPPAPRRAAPETAEIARPYQLVRTEPLAASELVTSEAGTVQTLTTATTGIAIVQTTATSGGFHSIGDDELLGILKDRPAMLVRMDARSERLVFLNPEDEQGFPIN